jgi:hypothetical protein
MKTILITGFSIIVALLGLLFGNINQRIDNCQTKEVCEQVTENIRTEIRLGNKNLETIMKTELEHIKEALKDLKNH